MANRAIIYRLYPTASQKLLLTKTFGCCRFVYNRLLSVQQERYKNGEKHLSRTHANNFCNRQLKSVYPFLREVDKDFYRVSLRSNDYVDVSGVASLFNGGGHSKAAGCDVHENLEVAIKKLVKETTKVL